MLSLSKETTLVHVIVGQILLQSTNYLVLLHYTVSTLSYPSVYHFIIFPKQGNKTTSLDQTPYLKEPNGSGRNNRICKKSEVLSAMNIKIMVFWDVTPCSLVDRYQNFGKT
jgi:hypothetical protein